MGFILNVVDLAMLNLVKSAAKHSVYNNTVYLINLIVFYHSRVNKASAADTVDLGSITGLFKRKLEKSLYSHPASRLDISNKMGSVKLRPCVIDNWPNGSLFSKNEQFFCCL